MSEPIQTLFAAVRSACSTATWSLGVELARAEAVRGESDDGSAIVLHVATRGGLVVPKTVLYTDDEDWDCDCASREAACEHVAAAVIALRKARRAGRELPSGRSDVGRIGYRLSRSGVGLDFERVVVVGGAEHQLGSTLAAITSGRVDGPEFLASPADLEVERALGTRLRGQLPRGLWPRLLGALATCADVTLDGTAIQTSTERIGLVARLEDWEDGFLLRVRRDPRVREIFEGELALLDDSTLCLLGATNLSGRELEEYRSGRVFSADRAAELVTEVLPSLRQRLPVEIDTKRLPNTSQDPPRIQIEVERAGDGLAVLPLLVYGDPPTARIDAGRLVPLGGPVPLRDEIEERALLRRLQNQLELAPGKRVVSRGEEALQLAERLRRWPGDVQGKALESFTRAERLDPLLTPTETGFDLVFEATDDSPQPGRASAAQVLGAWRSGDDWLPLTGGGFAPLPIDWLERYGTKVADLFAARSERGDIPPTALPELASLCEELELPVPAAALKLRKALAQSDDEAPSLPDDLDATLRHYQLDGVAWLQRLRDLGLGALLADDMGLGKTLQALCAVRGRSLVVAPTSVLPNWEAEARRFRPGLRIGVYHGPRRALDPEADLTLTTYALLRLDQKRLGKVDWDSVVLDEAQAIKNPDSQVARAAHGLQGEFRLTLTGTPVENRLDELWSQFQFLSPGWLGTRRDFDERYSRPVGAGDAEAAAHLRERIRPFVLRRLKREVAPELPPRTEGVLHVTLDEEERAVYDAVRAATLRDVTERFSQGGGVIQALEALLRLRQAACHSDLVPGQRADRSSKVEVLCETLDESVAEGHKALVFSQWTSLLDRIEPHLASAGIEYLRLDGNTRDRAGVVNRFQDRSGPPVLLVSLRAGGTGLNLTEADTVFIVDPWWNPAVEEQAADRAHRIGQDKPVMVYRLVTLDSVEEKVLALQAHKRALADAALGEGAAQPISREELFELLEG